MPKIAVEVPPVADAALMHSVIQRVATGPELSKNISYDEARSVMNALLEGCADPVQAAVFLIGLRMKRETDNEVKGVLDSLRENTTSVKSNASQVVGISDPYNGFNRTLHGSLFALPVIAACGLAVYSHGVALGGPKFGVTHHAIIKALGGNPLRSMDELANQLEDPAIGWGYADQSVFNPKLHALSTLRQQIIKRPVLSTTEVMLSPITGKDKTHLVTGYVHKPYREVYAMLARHMNYDSLLLIRGTEGGVIPSFKAKAHLVRYEGSESETEHDFELAPMGLARDYRAEDIPDTFTTPKDENAPIGMKWDIEALAKLCAEKGLRALDGEPGAILDAAVIGCALTLWHTGHCASLQEGAEKARSVINSGEALKCLHAGL